MKKNEKEFINEVTKLLKGEEYNKNKIIKLSKETVFTIDMSIIIYNKIYYILEYIFSLYKKDPIINQYNKKFRFINNKLTVASTTTNASTYVLKLIVALYIADSTNVIYEHILKAADSNFDTAGTLEIYKKDNILYCDSTSFAVISRVKTLYKFDIELIGTHLKKSDTSIIYTDTLESLKQKYINNNVKENTKMVMEINADTTKEKELINTSDVNSDITDSAVEKEESENIESILLDDTQIKSNNTEPLYTASELRLAADTYNTCIAMDCYTKILRDIQVAAAFGNYGHLTSVSFNTAEQCLIVSETIKQKFEAENITCDINYNNKIATADLILKW